MRDENEALIGRLWDAHHDEARFRRPGPDTGLYGTAAFALERAHMRIESAHSVLGTVEGKLESELDFVRRVRGEV